ncbi:MAG: caspase family protein [Bacteroidota bacterium]
MLHLFSVGINRYQNEKIPPLKACVRDVNRLANYVKTYFPEEVRSIKTLTNEAATYLNVVAGFRAHFKEVSEGDIAVFHFSGHGSRARSAPEFTAMNVDEYDECLIMHDSRMEGTPELADKELAVLIKEVSDRGAQMVMMLDCCHAGSATRSAGDFFAGRARHAWSNEGTRDLASYIGGYYLKHGPSVPESPHGLLSACTQFQQAWEGPGGMGIFTDALVGTLEKFEGDISYADLFLEVQKSVTRHPVNQSPQLESYGTFNPHHRFFTRERMAGRGSGERLRIAYQASSQSWEISRGVMQGMPQDLAQPMRFLVFDQIGSEDALGEAVLSRVHLNSSSLSLPAAIAAQTDRHFFAEVSSSPLPPLRVFTKGMLQPDWASPFITAVEEVEEAEYILDGADDHYRLYRASSGKLVREMPKEILDLRENTLATWPILIADLNRIHRWQHLLALQNSRTQFEENQVDFQFYERKNGEEIPYEGQDLVLDFYTKNGKPVPIWYSFKGRNHTDEPLHATLVNFSPKYGISLLYQGLLPADGKEMVLRDKGGLGIRDPKETDQTEHFLLIVSKQPQNNFLLAQENITPRPETGELLLALGAKRDSFEEPEAYPDDWFTMKIRIQIVRTEHEISAEGTQLAGQQIQVTGHEDFRAKLSLRAKGAPGPFQSEAYLFQEVFEKEGLPLADFSLPGASEQVNMLELSQLQQINSLADKPLHLAVKPREAQGDTLLPVAFDGEHFLVVGDYEAQSDGSTQISIDQVPEQGYDGRRSLGRALKMAFLQLVLQKEETHLTWVDYEDEEEIFMKEEGLAEKISQSQRILLLIHGIIGNNDESAESMDVPVGEEGECIRHAYDLVLTFAYENLNRPIEETAALLEEKLTQVGLGPGHTKELTIMSHSMGGLVSRYMIERLNGHAMVQKLVMAGTPNQGSEMGSIADYQKMAVSLLNIGLNFAKSVVPFASHFQTALKHTEKLFITLEQMKPGSDFLQELNNPNNKAPTFFSSLVIKLAKRPSSWGSKCRTSPPMMK